MITIGFLGPKGTFSQEAMRKYTKGSIEYTEVEFGSIHDIICAVRDKKIMLGFVPMENSIEGSVNETLDMLATQEGLMIKAEINMHIRQNLLVKKGTRKEDIKYILSHPQALGQCRNYINKNFHDAQIRSIHSTAKAAQEVSRGSGDLAAIGSAAAVEVYGLDVLEHDIQDNDNNFTRFVVLAENDNERTGNDKTSIVFSTEDKPGSLYRILDIFNLWDINMTKIESRPAKNKLGSYIFFIDISGHREDNDVKDALTMVKRKTSFFKLLGSYPVFCE